MQLSRQQSVISRPTDPRDRGLEIEFGRNCVNVQPTINEFSYALKRAHGNFSDCMKFPIYLQLEKRQPGPGNDPDELSSPLADADFLFIEVCVVNGETLEISGPTIHRIFEFGL